MHTSIALAATKAALIASGARDDLYELTTTTPSFPLELYNYTRKRKFPVPEQLARWHHQNGHQKFPFASLAEAPEDCRAFYTVFRAVAEALEPLHEPDPDPEPVAGAAPINPAAQPEPDAPVQQEPTIPEPEKPTAEIVDEVMQHRDEAQAETEKAIAESGGKFSDDEAKKKSK